MDQCHGRRGGSRVHRGRVAGERATRREAGTKGLDSGIPYAHPGLLPDDTPVAAAKNMPGDSADLFGDGAAEDGSAANGRLWRTVIIGEQEHRIDLHMIRPYMRVVTHGGESAALGLLLAPTANCRSSEALCEPQSLPLSRRDVKSLGRGRGAGRDRVGALRALLAPPAEVLGLGAVPAGKGSGWRGGGGLG